MKNLVKRILPTALAVCMLSCTFITASAAETPSSKEEVVYANLGAGGNVESVYTVNIYSDRNITDYGDYTQVKSLNTNDEVTYKGGKISVQTNESKLYCQGDMIGAELPWIVSVRYLLDGEQCPPNEIAGKSGNVEMQLKVEENKNCDRTFYENYALQISFSLDTNIFRNIKADGATVANVGSSKQLSYIVLPDNGLDETITANVDGFEMGSIAINGIRMNLDIEVDDEELKDAVNELIDACKQLDDGASEIKDGSQELKGGSQDLKDGAAALNSGISQLDGGISDLKNGTEIISKGLNELNSKSSDLTSGSASIKSALQLINSSLDGVSADTENLEKLVEASGEIKKAIESLYSGAAELQNNLGYSQYKAIMMDNGLDIDMLKQSNEEAANAVETQVEQLRSNLDRINSVPGINRIPGVDDQIAMFEEQIEQLENVSKLLRGNNAAMNGTEMYLNSIAENLPALTDGLKTLSENYAEFDAAINTLVTTLGGMVTDLSSLSEGINELVKQYETFDKGVNNYTDGVAQIVVGFNTLVSGVSSLASGSASVNSGSDSLYQGTSDLYDGVVSLCGGTEELNEGTSELSHETSKMDGEVDDKINSMLEMIQGRSEDVVSFVSDKNTNVKSVQFVLKTAEIEVPDEEEPEEAVEEEKSIWQKFLNLFGLD